MKKLFTLLAFLCSFYAHAQPDLTLGNISVPISILKKGDNISFTFSIKNIGNGASVNCHTSFYISSTTSINGAIPLGDVSTEHLQPNEETGTVTFIRNVPYDVAVGSNYLFISVDSRNEVAESNENNNTFYVTNPLSISSLNGGQQNLPYPIIMVHGLNSDSTTWDSLRHNFQNYYGWSYGGNMSFCLNQDGDKTKSDTTDSKDYKDFTNENNLQKADFYTINFNVDTTGAPESASNTFQSNESAIVKQGIAIRDAIKHVLKVTGRDKVILLCHSMGGLASRQYLQNSSMWQPDGLYHVAKLATIGTPHGGSNATSFGLGLGGVDEKSEAVRDLRYSYDISGSQGVYLFGGTESRDVMYNSLIESYYNVDVNCNGVPGDVITGLDTKDISTGLDYSCVIGDGDKLGGDGVVATGKANLKNNYPSLNVDTFICNEPIPAPIPFTDVWHNHLTQQTPFIMQALDESKYSSLGYAINLDTLYFGDFTVQSLGNSLSADNDNYIFAASSTGNVNVQLDNIPVSNCVAYIYDSKNALVGSISNHGQGSISAAFPVTQGTYTLSLVGVPDSSSWLSPYAFKVSFQSSLPLQLLSFTASNLGKYVGLNWQTADEINTKQFTVEKSVSGQNWDSIGAVAALDKVSNSYDFADYQIQDGTLYYRLKMFDKDGTFTYSPVRTVEFNTATGFYVTPNPAKDYATVYFKGLFTGEVSLYDAAGRKAFGATVNGATNYQIAVNGLTAGIYVVSAKGNNATYTQKLVITK